MEPVEVCAYLRNKVTQKEVGSASNSRYSDRSLTTANESNGAMEEIIRSV